MRPLYTACFLLISVLAVAAPEVAGSAQAPSPAPGLTVEGSGTAKLPADMIEYRAMLSSSGATLADVMLEYDRATTKLTKALEHIGGKGVVYELRGLTISSVSDDQFRKRQQQAMRYGQEVPEKCMVKDYVTIRAPLEGMQAKEVRDLVISILELSAEVNLNDATDRNMNYDIYGRIIPVELPDGWTPGMSFVLKDTTALYSAAVKKALEDARAKAEVQARLVGGTLGKIVGVETMSGGNIVPGRVRDLQHRVELRVRYELAGI